MAEISTTNVNGVWRIKIDKKGDDRGFFCEVFRKNLLSETGYDFNPIQWNHSLSSPSVIRGFHANPWAKLIYPVGDVFVCIADIDSKSPSYKKVFTQKVSGSEPYAFFLMPMLANAYCVLGDKPANYFYLVDKYYTEEGMKRIVFNDPELNVIWPTKNPVLSEADRNALPLSKLV